MTSNPFGPKFKSWIQQNLIYYAFNEHYVKKNKKIPKGLIIKLLLGLLICWADIAGKFDIKNPI